jgi:hypothetical protein
MVKGGKEWHWAAVRPRPKIRLLPRAQVFFVTFTD